MAIEPIKGFYVHDESNNQDGVAKLATDAYADSSVSTAKVADGAITEDKLGTALKTKVNQSHPNYWAQLDDDDLLEAVNIGGRIYEIIADTVEDGAISKEKLSEDLAAELENKADQDGDYDSLTAGGAKQLLSTVYVDDNEPYNFRTAGGSADIGDRMYEEVVGGSVAWNQFVNEASITTGTFDGVTATVSNHKLTITGTTERGTNVYVARPLSIVQGHKYLIAGTTKHYGMNLLFYAVDNSVMLLSVGAERPLVGNAIVNATVSDEHAMFYFNIGGANVEVDVESVPQFIDLTQMFGSTIADYIYSLEQSTAGAGVAWFRKLFPKPYYAYNAGELMSVKAGSHDTVGFNALDANTSKKNTMLVWGTGLEFAETGTVVSDFIPVVPASYNAKYICYAFGYDADKNYVGAWQGNVTRWAIPAQGGAGWNVNTFAVDNGIAYVRIVHRRNTGGVTDFTKVDDLCLHLKWDGERDGEYEPYEKHSYPLDELELRGIPKLDANNQLYYDGDTYASDGTVTRRCAVQTFTSCANVLKHSNDIYYATFTPSGGSSFDTTSANDPNAIASNGYKCNWSVVEGQFYFTNSGGTMVVVFTDQTMTTKSAVDAYLAQHPLTVVYLLATPTTETADTYVNPQVVDDFGTEEYTDYAVEAGDRDVAIPVGHNSQYMNNLRAKLEMAPDSPSGDGKYIVQQSNGENAYIPYTADGRLDAIEAKLPVPPSANGTYKLTATVTDGNVTYTWVAG